MKSLLSLTILFSLASVTLYGQNLPNGIVMKDIPGGIFTMGSNSLIGSPDQKAAAPEHQVSLSAFSISEAEITNAQYVEFLNSALSDGLIQVTIGSAGPDNGKSLIQGTVLSSYFEKTLYTLDGTRVMKDHDNEDGDNNPFTGSIEPENPLNIAFIGFNAASNEFYLKNPHDPGDFDWFELCNYRDYGTTQGSFDSTEKNDFEDWSGAGLGLSDELVGWTSEDPTAALNLPTQDEVASWPVTFIRWWGAKAFAEYYNMDLPTEAQWEYAAKGGQDFEYAVFDGVDVSDANWNQDNLTVATHHVRATISGSPNPFGLYNLAGNVWEWMADNYVAPYDTDPVSDPFIEIQGSTLRSWRGGSWNYHLATLQSAMRFSDQEDRGNDHFGFRIAGKQTVTSSLDWQAKGTVKIFPNPAISSFIILLPNNKKVLVQIYNLNGRMKYSQIIQGQERIITDSWDRGIYFLRIKGQVQKISIL